MKTALVSLILLLTGLLAVPVFSQDVKLSAEGSRLSKQEIPLTGKVVDRNGRELEGVKIVLQDTLKGRVVLTLSGNAGEFRLNGLNAGKYNITFELEGFEHKLEKDVEVITGYENTILVRMQDKRKQKRKLK